MLNLRVATVVASTLAVALAGCTSDPQTIDGAVDEDGFGLAAGTGGIHGLLVDDRFRPLELTDTPAGEFQREGFILLQELGLTAQSNANGEFTFVDLEPGVYTLRMSVEGHEGVPETIRVDAGVFADATLVVRRIASVDGAIITQEHTVYIDCAFDYLQNGGNGLPPHVGIGCDLDVSQDGYSSNFIADYSSFGANATWLVTEMLANQENSWELQLRGSTIHATEWATGDGARIVLERGVKPADHQDNPSFNHGAWHNAEPFQTILFVDHAFRQEQQDATGGLFCCGVGASLGIRAQILQSVFLGPPEEDVAAYCVLC